MHPLNIAGQEELARESGRLTVCGVVYKVDGTALRCTQFDDDLEVVDGDLAGTYLSSIAITGSDIKSASDLSVDNLEVSGAFADGVQITGFTVQDVRAGQFRNAPFEIFLCQWDDPNAWQRVIRRGYLGNITTSAEGAFTAEWRGLLQTLQQNIGRTYGQTCDVLRFGDSRCKIDLTSLKFTTTITAITSRRQFAIDTSGSFGIPSPAEGYLDFGEMKFLSGTNSGYTKQIKRDSVGGTFGMIELWESLPKDIALSTSVEITPGCNRLFERCQFWNNTDNFRGHGLWIPGMSKIIRAPGANNSQPAQQDPSGLNND